MSCIARTFSRQLCKVISSYLLHDAAAGRIQPNGQVVRHPERGEGPSFPPLRLVSVVTCRRPRLAHRHPGEPLICQLQMMLIYYDRSAMSKHCADQ